MRKIVNKIQKFQSAKPISTKLGVKEEIKKMYDYAAAQGGALEEQQQWYDGDVGDFKRSLNTFVESLESIRFHVLGSIGESQKILGDFKEAGLDDHSATKIANQTIAEGKKFLDTVDQNLKSGWDLVSKL